MKRKVLSLVSLGISLIFALIFSFIEFRALFAGDFTLMNNPAMSFMTYLFRGLFFFSTIVLVVVTAVQILRNKKLNLAYAIIALAIALSSFITFSFYEYYITIVIIFFTDLPLLVIVLNVFRKEEGK